MVGVDLKACEPVMDAACEGKVDALAQLIERLWPFWLNRVRTRTGLRALGGAEDHVHNVVVRLVEKLSDPETLRDYRSWRDREASGTFSGWLYTVTDHEVINYVREVAGRSSPAKRDTSNDEALPSPKLFLNVFATSGALEHLGTRPPYTDLQLAAELMTFAEKRLSRAQLAALELWLSGAADEDIDVALELPAGSGRALMRAAVATLRREFAPD